MELEKEMGEGSRAKKERNKIWGKDFLGMEKGRIMSRDGRESQKMKNIHEAKNGKIARQIVMIDLCVITIQCQNEKDGIQMDHRA